ncbi:serine hydrolase domain-containing protein [Lapidilactobacillus wuchangensis]|uniref:serine hydrolase domain-containing protein n=1 Tax=Lapidilactobacillus wuchangensis TaxID=2486001 RepID=UPI000F766850|nr:serine hydrolase domain-containing protein [Lapidilactobacillus wuchangensis]
MMKRRKQQFKWVTVVLTVLVVALIGTVIMRRNKFSRASDVQPAKSQRVASTTKLTHKATKQSSMEINLIGTTNQQLQNQLVTRLQNIGFIGTGIIAQNGQIVATWTSGDANAQTKQSNTLDTIYNINSMQKSITAVLVMQQIEQGRLSLTDSLAEFYPDVTNSRNITIQQLLAMTSGLTDAGLAAGTYVNDQTTITNDIAQLQYQANWYNKWNYQPINYVLLAGILEKVTGQTYREIFTRNIAEKLNLTHTVFGYDLLGATNVPLGYSGPLTAPYAQAVPLDVNQQHSELGTGQLYMSAPDFYLFMRSALNGTLISTTSAAQLFSGSYGGGMYNATNGIKLANGAGVNFGSTVHVNSNGQAAIVLLSNFINNYNQMKSVASELDTMVLLNGGN